MDTIKFGKFMANLRNEKNLTQEELAEKLYIDKRKVSRWECGMSIPDFDTLIEISKIFDVSLYELSICERIKDDSIPRKVLNKFRSIKDFKRYKLKKKIIFIISIFIRLFFIFTAIYTIKFYGAVEVYELISNDKEYDLNGLYIHTNNYTSYSIDNLHYAKTHENVISYDDKCTYEIYNKNIRIAHLKENQNSNTSYDDTIKLVDDETIDLKTKTNNIFQLKITCKNSINPPKEYLINLQFIKKYDNKLF